MLLKKYKYKMKVNMVEGRKKVFLKKMIKFFKVRKVPMNIVNK